MIEKKVARFIEFFLSCVYIIPVTNKKEKDMNTTTIRTSSKNLYERIHNYIKNKRISFVPSISNNSYAITLFGLDNKEADTLIIKMTRHFHLRKMISQEAQVGRDTSRPYWPTASAA